MHIDNMNELKRAPNRTLANLGLEKTMKKIKQQGLSIPEELSPILISS